MNMKQVWGAVGGFFVAFLLISLTNKPHVTPRDPNAPGAQPGGPGPGAQEPPRNGPAPGTAIEPANAGTGGLASQGLIIVGSNADAFTNAACEDAIARSATAGAGWLALSPIFTVASAHASHVTSDPQRTPSAEALGAAIARCHSRGLKVLVRPVVASPGGETGAALGPAAADERGWLQDYEAAVSPLLDVAEQQHAEAFSLASCAPQAAWSELIGKARGRYHGKLTFGASLANAEYKQVGFWRDLDYVGLEGGPASDWAQAASDVEAFRNAQNVSAPAFFMAAEGGRPAFDRAFADKAWVAGTLWREASFLDGAPTANAAAQDQGNSLGATGATSNTGVTGASGGGEGTGQSNSGMNEDVAAAIRAARAGRRHQRSGGASLGAGEQRAPEPPAGNTFSHD